MADLNLVVVFYSRTGLTESLALRAAVGGVQSRANIRLRRLPDSASEDTIAAAPAWRENRDRMNREFIAPRPADIEWADVFVLGTPAGFAASSAEWRAYFDLLEAVESSGKLAGKVGCAFTPVPANHAALQSLYAEMSRLGLITVPAPAVATAEDACALARRAAAIARAVKPVPVSWPVPAS